MGDAPVRKRKRASGCRSTSASAGVEIGGVADDRSVVIRSLTTPYKVAPAPAHLQVGFINIPAPAHLAPPPTPETFCQRRGELGFPFADRLMAEHHTAQGKHLRQIAKGKFVAQAPEHHEGDDVGRVLRPVQHGAATLIELLPALATAEPAIALAVRSGRSVIAAELHPTHRIPSAPPVSGEPIPGHAHGAQSRWRKR